jgi:hypothetical protein
MMLMTRVWMCAALFQVLVLFSGCASMQPLSNYARSGDTVMISLGGSDSNALLPVLKKENLSVTITDSLGDSYPVKVRNLFRVNSDAASGYAFRSPTTNMYYDSYVDPHQGLWLAVLDLVDPADDTPLPLAAGTASFAVSSSEIQNWVDYPGYGWSWTNGNLDSIPIEILAGAGSANPMNFLGPVSSAPLDSLEPNPQVEVSASGNATAEIGGGMFVFQLDNADFGGVVQRPRAVATVPDSNIQLMSRRVDMGDGTSQLTVVILNPHGFRTDNSKIGLTGGMSLRRSLRFSLVWASTNAVVTDGNWQNSLQLLSGGYFDVDGNDMPELTVTLEKVR